MPGARSNRPAEPARCGSPHGAQRARPPVPKVQPGLALLCHRARRHSANRALPCRSSSSLPAPARTAIAQSSEFPKNPGVHANKPPASRHTGLPKGYVHVNRGRAATTDVSPAFQGWDLAPRHVSRGRAATTDVSPAFQGWVVAPRHVNRGRAATTDVSPAFQAGSWCRVTSTVVAQRQPTLAQPFKAGSWCRSPQPRSRSDNRR
jgi:hypothetical protein